MPTGSEDLWTSGDLLQIGILKKLATQMDKVFRYVRYSKLNNDALEKFIWWSEVNALSQWKIIDPLE